MKIFRNIPVLASPMPSWRPALIRALAAENLPIWGYLALYGLIFLTYLYYAVEPAYLNDDIDVIQDKPGLSFMLKQGRWAKYFVVMYLLKGNTIPVLSIAIGALLLMGTAFFAARIFNLRHPLSIASFILIGSISIYYANMFDLDYVRIAYPLGNFCVVYGLYRAISGRFLSGIFFIAFAPAFYQATVGLGATMIMLLLIQRMTTEGVKQGIKDIVWPSLAFGLGIILYLILTHIIAVLGGYSLGQRVNMDFLSLNEKFRVAILLLKTHSPLAIFPEHFILETPLIRFILAAFFLLFLGYVLYQSKRRDGTIGVAILILVIGASFIAPFCLLFASQDLRYPPRSVYGYSAMQAFWAAFLLDKTLAVVKERIWALRASLGLSLLVIGFVGANSVQINSSAFDQYLASETDMAGTLQIISRINNVLGEAGDQRKKDIPLAVLYNLDVYLKAGPRGEIVSNRIERYTREMIFHLIDQRFYPADNAQQLAALKAAADREEWPAKDSVFLLDGVVVVVLQK